MITIIKPVLICFVMLHCVTPCQPSELYSPQEYRLLNRLAKEPSGYLIACGFITSDQALMNIQAEAQSAATEDRSFENLMIISMALFHGTSGIYSRIEPSCVKQYQTIFPAIPSPTLSGYRKAARDSILKYLGSIDDAMRSNCSNMVVDDKLSKTALEACNTFRSDHR